MPISVRFILVIRAQERPEQIWVSQVGIFKFICRLFIIGAFLARDHFTPGTTAGGTWIPFFFLSASGLYLNTFSPGDYFSFWAFG